MASNYCVTVRLGFDVSLDINLLKVYNDQQAKRLLLQSNILKRANHSVILWWFSHAQSLKDLLPNNAGYKTGEDENW